MRSNALLNYIYTLIIDFFLLVVVESGPQPQSQPQPLKVLCVNAPSAIQVSLSWIVCGAKMHTKPLTLNPITWGRVATWVCLHWSINSDGFRDAGCHCSWHWGHHHTNFICDWSLISLRQRECGSFLEVNIWKQRNSVWHSPSSWTGEYHIGGFQSQIDFISTIHLVAVFLPVT